MEKLRVRWGGDEVNVEEEPPGQLKFSLGGEEDAVLDRDSVVLLTRFLERWLGVTR